MRRIVLERGWTAARLRRAGVLVGLALAAIPPLQAAADDGLHLTWNDCWLGSSPAGDAVFDCLTNDVVHRLVAGFVLDASIDSVIAIEVVVDVQHADAVLPAWWQLGPDGCREVSLAAAADFVGMDGCTTPWGSAAVALVQDYEPGQPRGGANQARIKAVVAVPSDSARTFAAGVGYSAVELRIDSQRTTGLGLCSGCQAGACIVLNSIWVRRLPGGSGDVYLSTPAAVDGNRVTWQGGGTAECAAVPVRAVTWGRVKSLYR